MRHRFLSVIQYQFNRVISPRSEIVRAHPQGCRSTYNCSVKGKMTTKLSEGKTIIRYNIPGSCFQLGSEFCEEIIEEVVVDLGFRTRCLSECTIHVL